MDRVYGLFGLLAFATAQPVYDLLKGNAQFLVVHDLDLIDLCVLLTAISLGPILPATAVLMVARRVGPTESRIIYCQSRQREDCFQKAVIKRGLRRIRRSALRARSSSSQ